MKKWVFGCAMALVITSCDNKKFSIQGRVADADGQVLYLAYIIHSGFISGYQNRYGDNLKPPTNVYHRMTA